jgi:hypothetical protein
MADANDSKSFGKPCGFKSHLRYTIANLNTQRAGKQLWTPGFLFLTGYST